MKIKTVGIFPNIEKPGSLEFVNKAVDIFAGLGVKSVVPEKITGVSADVLSIERFLEAVDMVFVFGGDGTFLRAARQCCKAGVPLLGINTGSLGFLTEFTKSDFEKGIGKILSGDYQIAELMMFKISVMDKGKVVNKYKALNDVVINRGAFSRAVEIKVAVDGEVLNEYYADGLIVSTPTGSTAHSLSAGGPIVVQKMEAMIITPICPHSLSNRPVIVPPSSRVEFSLSGSRESAKLTVDGQIGLDVKDSVVVEKNIDSVKLVRPREKSYFEILREKLNWSGSFKTSQK